MEFSGGKNQQFRHPLFFPFHWEQQAAEVPRNICAVYEKGTIKLLCNGFPSSKRVISIWTTDFVPVELSSSTRTDLRRLQRKTTFKHLDDHRKDGYTHPIILSHLHSIGCEHKFIAWVPHELNKILEKNRLQMLLNISSDIDRHGPQATIPVHNRHGRCEMLPLRQREAEKGMSGTRRHAKTQYQARTLFQEDHDLCLVRLGGSRALED